LSALFQLLPAVVILKLCSACLAGREDSIHQHSASCLASPQLASHSMTDDLQVTQQL